MTKANPALITQRIEDLVWSGNWKCPDCIRDDSKLLGIRKPELTRRCQEFYDRQCQILGADEIQWLLRVCIFKVEKLSQKANLTPNEITSAARTLSQLLSDYNELIAKPDVDTGFDEQLLNTLLTELYKTEDGIKLVERIEAQLRNNNVSVA